MENEKSRSGRLLYLIISAAIAVFVIAADRITKALAVKYLYDIDTYPVIDGVFHFTYAENTGAAFGMMKDSRWLFMLLSSAAIIIIAVWLIKYGGQDLFMSVCLSMILGGGVGNMIDRIAYGYVVDFVDVRLINFAIFNVADSFVTVGAFLMIIYLIRELITESKQKKESGADTKGEDNSNAGE